MSRSRKMAFWCAGGTVLITIGLIVSSVIRHAGAPKFEGKTADQWLEEVEGERRRKGLQMYNLDDLTQKELTAAFLTFGVEGQKELLREYLEFERPTGWRTNLYALNDKLPGWARLKMFSNPEVRVQLVAETLNLIKPSWFIVEPLVKPVMEGNSASKLRSLDYLFGMIGDGATNAVPFLVEGRTNRSSLAIQSLMFLAESASNAVPALVEDLKTGRESLGHMHILRQIGPAAVAAVPALENLLDAKVSRVDSQSIAAAILAIDLDHQVALKHLDEYFEREASKKKLEWSEWFCLYWIKGPNKPAAELLLKYLDESANMVSPGRILLQLDPETGVPVLRKKVAEITQRSNICWVLLKHDPYDEVTLKLLVARVANDFFPRDAMATQWLYALQNCYPDSPGVIDALNHAESVTIEEQILKEIALTRRHIELNDLLRQLREAKDSARTN